MQSLPIAALHCWQTVPIDKTLRQGVLPEGFASADQSFASLEEAQALLTEQLYQ